VAVYESLVLQEISAEQAIEIYLLIKNLDIMAGCIISEHIQVYG
jgi:hypothetical protein